MTLKTPSGEVEYTIAGVVWSPGLDVVVGLYDLDRQFDQRTAASVFGTLEDAKRDFHAKGAEFFVANLEMGVQREELVKRVRAVVGAWGLAAYDVRQIKYNITKGLNNLLLLVAILSMLQATLTLPGMAAMALALGMAIDSNVLINERVREELRNGASPQAAIHAGYDRAWATILDSNVTTLIAGVALLAFGSGPVRGFAVVHVIGILTSMFSAVFFSRGLVNFWYGRKKKLKTVSIGTVWRPGADHAITKAE